MSKGLQKGDIVFNYKPVVWERLAKQFNRHCSITIDRTRQQVRIELRTYDEEEARELEANFGGTLRFYQRPRSTMYRWRLRKAKDVILVLENTMQYLDAAKADKAVEAVRLLKTKHSGQRLYG